MNIRDLVMGGSQEIQYRLKKRGTGPQDYSHSQLLHLTSTQLDRILVPDTPDGATNQIVIEFHPGLCLRVTRYMPGILDRPVQVCVKSFNHLVDELFGTTKSCCLSDPGFIMCVPRVTEPNIVFDLLHTKQHVSSQLAVSHGSA